MKVHGYYRQGALYQSMSDANNFTAKFINVTLPGEPFSQFYKECDEREALPSILIQFFGKSPGFGLRLGQIVYL